MAKEQVICDDDPLISAAKCALSELSAIRRDIVAETASSKSLLDSVHPSYKASAENLLNYLALRRRDLRPLQLRLAEMGLSSLGRAEAHVLATVDSAINVLERIVGRPLSVVLKNETVDFKQGQRILLQHAEELFGPTSPMRGVRIMVTMPSEAASDDSIVHNLLAQGMNCMRINCAHDNSDLWLQMIENLRRAEQALGKSCKIVMDLAGPKLRTGPITSGPEVIKIRPQRNLIGEVVAPAQAWLIPSESPNTNNTTDRLCIPVPSCWLSTLNEGDTIKFMDARDAKRSFVVAAVSGGECRIESCKTSYIVSGTRFHTKNSSLKKEFVAAVGNIPPTEGVIDLNRGDLLLLTRDTKLGHPSVYNHVGCVIEPATIGCTIPEIFDQVKVGESIYFDDGKIGGVIEQAERQQLHIRIEQAGLKGAKLRSDKGINLPQSELVLPALTEKDIEDLKFVAMHADIIEMSFANTPQDVVSLQKHLVGLGMEGKAIVLKIETRRGFENLPDMLFTAMKAPCCGVMIARGDLAVECGFERLAEVQEEILWICEAAHVPVIWATQVLESLAKEGQPTRAEITDVSMGDRAECVMLNKGPHILAAVRVLDDILGRMDSHQSKKLSLLRELRLAHFSSVDEYVSPIEKTK